MDIYFILWVIIQYYHDLFHCSNYYRFGQKELFWLLCPFEMKLIFFSLLCFLTPQNAPWSSCIFLASAPKWTTYLRNPDFLYWRIVFKNQYLSISIKYTHCYSGVMASSYSQQTKLLRDMVISVLLLLPWHSYGPNISLITAPPLIA